VRNQRSQHKTVIINKIVIVNCDDAMNRTKKETETLKAPIAMGSSLEESKDHASWLRSPCTYKFAAALATTILGQRRIQIVREANVRTRYNRARPSNKKLSSSRNTTHKMNKPHAQQTQG